MFAERHGIIVWLNDTKSARNLEKYGTLHYVSKRMFYAVLYVHADRTEETMKSIQRLPYVKKVERSYRGEIPTEYSSNIPDKTRFYSY
ncbi:YlbG family protein [Paenibacillus alkalitolerans]|uniref:YlbG family protein n=1 Tax=Paenibacillus alkalitolerans TaxID=2799335 RepID=UPI0018F5A8F6|nr:YlbG family protein [Paenibacillus alkalitolerans]